MKITRIESLPNGNRYYASKALDGYEINALKKAGIYEAWYWYGTSPWEGNGLVLYKIGDEYGLHNMGHCSCYGPVDELEISTELPEKLVSSLSEKLYEEAKSLLQAAGLVP